MIEEINSKLIVANEFRVRETLRIIKLNKGMDTLGVLLVPDSSIEDKFQYLMNKSLNWANAIRLSTILGYEVQIGFNSIINKTL